MHPTLTPVISFCLKPDDFTRQGESVATQSDYLLVNILTIYG